MVFLRLNSNAMRVLFFLSILLHATRGDHHPCSGTNASSDFASSCGQTNGDIFACLLRSATRISEGVVPRRGGIDPLSMLFSDTSFVGMLYPADGENVVPLSFDPIHTFVVRCGSSYFTCTKGEARGSAGDFLSAHAYTAYTAYTYEVYLEHSNWMWDPPWDAAGPSPFGSAARHVYSNTLLPSLETTGVVLELGGSASLQKLPSDGYSCLARIDGGVLILGDSNSRRSTKALQSAGAWCSANHSTAACVCEDSGEDGAAVGNAMGGTEKFQISNSSAWLGYRWFSGSYSAYGTLAQLLAPPELAGVRVLVLAGFESWEVAGRDLSAFVASLSGWAADIHGALHGTDIRLVFRTMPYFCCGYEAGDVMSRRYTAKRSEIFAMYYRLVMSRAFPAALWWDSRRISGERPLYEIKKQAIRCASNHMDSVLVEDDVRAALPLLC